MFAQRRGRAWLAAWALLGHGPATSAETDELSLEDLLKAEVTAASRKPQSLQATAAAAFVVTREDITRSGATSIAEALRLAPGVEVARIANNRTAVSMRGFNGRFANKLLVLMDGRSLYSPTFSGVTWEFEDTLIEDVERIEVIRGPGAAMWGANAVNGVIDIITRKARDTQGELAIGHLGTAARMLAERHGGTVAGGHYRLWGKYSESGTSQTAAGVSGNDGLRVKRIGGRGDWSLAGHHRVMLSGEVYSGSTGDVLNSVDVTAPPAPFQRSLRRSGGNLLARQDWQLDGAAEAALQTYVDSYDAAGNDGVHHGRRTLDVDFQYRSPFGSRHDLMVGLGYRLSPDYFDSDGAATSLSPTSRTYRLASSFINDDISLIAETLRLTAGARLEDNNFSGTSLQPNLRLLWTPTPEQSAWAAVSRAERTPSRSELDAQSDVSLTPASGRTPPVLLRTVPAPDHQLQAEKVTAFELGYRRQFGNDWSVDATAFSNRYRDLRGVELGTLGVVRQPVVHVVQNLVIGNQIEARTHGVELALDLRATPWWRLQSSLGWLRVNASATNDDAATISQAATMSTSAPERQLSLRSSMNLAGRQQLDAWLRYVSGLGQGTVPAGSIPAYNELDLRYAWRPTPALSLALIGQNLLHRSHAEFLPDLPRSPILQIERSAALELSWRFDSF